MDLSHAGVRPRQGTIHIPSVLTIALNVSPLATARNCLSQGLSQHSGSHSAGISAFPAGQKCQGFNASWGWPSTSDWREPGNEYHSNILTGEPSVRCVCHSFVQVPARHSSGARSAVLIIHVFFCLPPFLPSLLPPPLPPHSHTVLSGIPPPPEKVPALKALSQGLLLVDFKWRSLQS